MITYSPTKFCMNVSGHQGAPTQDECRLLLWVPHLRSCRSRPSCIEWRERRPCLPTLAGPLAPFWFKATDISERAEPLVSSLAMCHLCLSIRSHPSCLLSKKDAGQSVHVGFASHMYPAHASSYNHTWWSVAEGVTEIHSGKHRAAVTEH